MILFAVLAGMALIVVLCVLVPLLRPHAALQPRAAHDVEIYRDQLAEVERDHARGLVTDGQLEASRAEIGRRLLAADAAREGAPASGERSHPRAILAVVLAAVLPLAAGGLYFWQGAPIDPGSLASEGVAARSPAQPAASGTRPVENDADMATLVERLVERMKERPGDARGWRLLGRSLASLERYSEAARAYGRASALLPADPDVKSLHGETLAAANGGTVTPQAERAFAAALQIDPGEPRARYYLGLAALQKGDRDAALARWRALQADSPEDAEWLPMLRNRIASLAPSGTAGAVDGPARQQIPAPGPTDEDIAAAQEMLPEERAQMIRGMVARLALRLEEEPNDAEGWARLARSYRVLGEPAKERDALAALARLRPDDVEVLSAYARSLRTTARDGTPPRAFDETIDRILALDPDNHAALQAAGSAADRAGDPAAALRHWKRLRLLLPEGSPERVEIDRRIESLGEAK